MKTSIIALVGAIAISAPATAQPINQYLFDGFAGPGFVLNTGSIGGNDLMIGHSLTGVAPDGSPCLLGSGIPGHQIQTSVAPAVNLAAGSFTIGFCLDTSANGAFQYCFGDLGTTWRCFAQGSAGVGAITMRGAGLTDCAIPGGSGDAGWVHVAWTYNAVTGDVLGYLNGVLATTVPGVVMTHNSPLATTLYVAGDLGASGTSNLSAGSQMEDFRLYDSVQTGAHIQTWACTCLAGSITPPEWDTNSPEAAVVTDGASSAGAPGPITILRPLGGNAVIDFQSTLTGAPYEIVFTLGADTAVAGSAGGIILPGCPNAGALNISLLAPSFGSFYNLSFAVPFAGFTLPVSSAVPFAASYQMGVVNPASPLGLDLSAATDLSFAPVSCVTVEAEGANLFNSVTTNGGWKVIHSGNCNESIESVTIDNFNAAPGSPAAGVRWDTDQGGMADRFDGGNSVVPGSLGTYRNGSDVASGLIYDALNTPTSSTLDPTANTGYIASNPSAVTNSYHTLQFRFTPGAFFNTTFEWDMDPDGGLPGGAGQDGCFVTVVTNLATYSGFMVADALTPNRAFINFP